LKIFGRGCSITILVTEPNEMSSKAIKHLEFIMIAEVDQMADPETRKR
jgi:hypothetical protein